MTQDAGWTRRGAIAVVAAAGASAVAPPLRAAAARFEVLAESLAFPEGPVAMPDGSVICVELLGGRITRVWNGRKEVVCAIGGGPNGAQLGPDGALYVCNNGGAAPGRPHLADASQPGRIERVDLRTGKSERIYEKVGDRPLSAPNDLVFDADGGMWFTDFGKVREHEHKRGGIYYCKPDGSHIREIAYDGFGYNGIGLTPDGKGLYVARYEAGRLYRLSITGPGTVAPDPSGRGVRKDFVGGAAGIGEFDGLAVTRSGNICIGTNMSGGITTLTPSGEASFMPMPDRMVTNITFGGPDMRDAYVTLATTGRLVRMRWDEPGLELNWRAPAKTG